MNKKKIKIILIIFIAVLVVTSGMSYAFYMYTQSQEGYNVVKSECFRLSFSDKNNINLLESIPMSENDASGLTPYEFTIKNVCNIAALYDVNIETLNDSTLNENFIRFKLDSNDSDILGYKEENENVVNSNALSSRTIETAILLPSEERTFNLRMWLDEDSSTEAASKTYSSKVVVVASMRRNPYIDIAFDADGGTIDDNAISFVDGRVLNNLPTPTKEGYIFLGWYKSTDFNDEDSVGNGTVADSSMTHLYAKYVPGTYKLSIDPDGGEYLNSSGVYEENITYKNTFVLQAPIKVGYTFKGWNVVRGKETRVDNDIVTMGVEDSYIRASYEINKYNLTIKLNNGSSDQVYEMEYNSSKEITTPTREGYTFTGWSVSGGKLSTNTFTIGDSDATLKANWVVNDYKWVVYHNKMNIDGVGYTLAESESGHGNYGTLFKGTLKNYVGFTNPNQASSTIGIDVKYGEDGTPKNNLLNYNYARNKYSISVNPNGGTYSSSTGTTTHSNIYYGATYTINNPTRVGYNFGGWTLGGVGSSISGTTFTMGSENASLTAKWSAKTYTVTLNNQSATVAGSTSVTATYASALPKITVPTRTGYTFGGYYTSTGGTGTQYINASGASVKNWDLDANTTLYAKWVADTYTVAYDYNYLPNNVFSTYYDTTLANIVPNVSSISSRENYSDSYGTGFKITAKSTDKQYVGSSDGFYFPKLKDLTVGDTWTLMAEVKSDNSTNTVTFNNESANAHGSVKLSTSWQRMTLSGKIVRNGGTVTFYSWINDLNNYKNLYVRNLQAQKGDLYTTSASKSVYSQLGTLPTAPSRSGFKFQGWYTSPIGGTKVSNVSTIPYNSSKVFNLYAQWTRA